MSSSDWLPRFLCEPAVCSVRRERWRGVRGKSWRTHLHIGLVIVGFHLHGKNSDCHSDSGNLQLKRMGSDCLILSKGGLAAMQTDDHLLKPEQVAERLNLSVDWVRDHSSRKMPRLPVIRLRAPARAVLLRYFANLEFG